MPNTKTIRVAHLGGIDAAYQMPNGYDRNKDTVVLINSFATSSELFQPQFADKKLNDLVNLVAIEPLGHGQTATIVRHFTYWDTAYMNLQVLDALRIRRFFVLGTSQGGFLAARMALVAPERILGIIPLATSLDYESERTLKLGCWNGADQLNPFIEKWTSRTITPNFVPSDEFCDFLIDLGFGKHRSQETRDFWLNEIKANYSGENYRGDDARQRGRVAMINVRDRDGLLGRFFDLRCPVLWLHGTADQVFSVENAQDEVKLLVNSPSAELRIVQDGQNFLSFTHPNVVDDAVIEFVKKFGKRSSDSRPQTPS